MKIGTRIIVRHGPTDSVLASHMYAARPNGTVRLEDVSRVHEEHDSKMGTLADRFIDFCRSVPGAEEVDTLPLTNKQAQLPLKRADFLFEKRTIICEVKALETDSSPKFIDLWKREGFDLSPGEYNVREVFAARPNGDRLFAELTTLVARSVADDLAKANKQIRDTKNLFGLVDADGVVVILNGLVEILGPQLVISRIGQRLQKSTEDGAPYHDNIAAILYFSEKHVRASEAGDAAVTFQIPNPRVNARRDLEAFGSTLVEGWAKFNGRWFRKQALTSLS